MTSPGGSSSKDLDQLEPQAVISMGDKSQKAKDRARKQDVAVKTQKKADAVSKANANTMAGAAAKKGK